MTHNHRLEDSSEIIPRQGKVTLTNRRWFMCKFLGSLLWFIVWLIEMRPRVIAKIQD
uniref:Uncharacterized protein n=1 Tax=Picea glauca TaxID=3330 RepID=A0A101LYZ2_PICGL|nr:hypothetical protein ABT39_MTgene1459 [Picea glauca]KUM47910.1 hypothetical protein ABT39_MTgene4905 [Picea glauca]KUM47919.1 hypothetical protein ABT39_MTgene4914 [Picea glauca]